MANSSYSLKAFSGYSGASGYSSSSGVSGFSGSGPGGITWSSYSGNHTSFGFDGVLADTTVGAWVLTMPAPPSNGTMIGVMDAKGGFQAANLTISGNGYWIMGYGADLTCNRALQSFSLVYSGPDMGWNIYPSYPSSTTVLGATKGYRCGGNVAYNATTDRTTFSTDTTAAVTTANLTQGRIQSAGFDGSSGGYVVGGYTGAVVVTADKLTYSSEATAAQTSANLSQARAGLGAVSNGYSKGYSLGGYTSNPAPDGFNTADKTTFSNDTTAAQTSANLSQARSFLVGLNGGPSKGYALGGATNNGTVIVSTADKIVYSSDTTAACASITSPNMWPATCAGRLKGFLLGGTSGAFTASAIKITYSTDASSAATSANIGTAKYSPFGFADAADGKGYVLGGFTGAYVNVATTEKVTFSTETTASATTANLSVAISQGANLTNQPAVTWS